MTEDEFEFGQPDELAVREVIVTKKKWLSVMELPVDLQVVAEAVEATETIDESPIEVQAIVIDDSVYMLKFPENVMKIEPVLLILGEKEGRHTYINRQHMSSKLPSELYRDVMDYLSGRKAK